MDDVVERPPSHVSNREARKTLSRCIHVNAVLHLVHEEDRDAGIVEHGVQTSVGFVKTSFRDLPTPDLGFGRLVKPGVINPDRCMIGDPKDNALMPVGKSARRIHVAPLARQQRHRVRRQNCLATAGGNAQTHTRHLRAKCSSAVRAARQFGKGQRRPSGLRGAGKGSQRVKGGLLVGLEGEGGHEWEWIGANWD